MHISLLLQRRGLGRRARLGALLSATALTVSSALVPASATPTPPDDAGNCIEAGYVWVVVDDGTGNETDLLGGCATDFSTGAKALTSAGFTIDSEAFVTSINGVTTDYYGEGTYWSYWFDENPTAGQPITWEYSEVGLGNSEPQPGSIEGWRVAYNDSTMPRLKTLPSPTKRTFEPVTITAPPQSLTVGEGLKASFTVNVEGSGPTTVRWETTADGTSWTSVAEGKDLFSYTITAAQMSENQMLIRAVVDNAANQPATSEAAILTVKSAEYAVIPDPVLRKCISDKNGEAEGILTKEGLKTINELSCVGSDEKGYIEDLTGLEYLTNATKIVLTKNRIDTADLTVFSDNPWDNLEVLYLVNNPIDSADALKNKPFKEVNIANAQLTDLSWASALPNLEKLVAWGNKITTTSNLKNETLRELDVQDNQITDVLDLSGLPQLTRLIAHGNRDRSGTQLTNGFRTVKLADPSKLTTFAASENRIDDLSALKGITKGASLNISNNWLTDLSPLNTMTPLQDPTGCVSGCYTIDAATQSPQLTVYKGVPTPIPAFLTPDKETITPTWPNGVTVDTSAGTMTWTELSPAGNTFPVTWNKSNGSKLRFSGTLRVTVIEQPHGRVYVDAVDDHGSSLLSEPTLLVDEAEPTGNTEYTVGQDTKPAAEITVSGITYELIGWENTSAPESGKVIEGDLTVKYAYRIKPSTTTVTTTSTVSETATTTAEPMPVTTTATAEPTTSTVATATTTSVAPTATQTATTTTTAAPSTVTPTIVEQAPQATEVVTVTHTETEPAPAPVITTATVATSTPVTVVTETPNPVWVTQQPVTTIINKAEPRVEPGPTHTVTPLPVTETATPTTVVEPGPTSTVFAAPTTINGVPSTVVVAALTVTQAAEPSTVEVHPTITVPADPTTVTVYPTTTVANPNSESWENHFTIGVGLLAIIAGIVSLIGRVILPVVGPLIPGFLGIEP
ncbi:MAG: hypothetical protein SPI77_06170 [Corynebacterium sp.]|nr:hypothetical protein [Corynebacterium sp.]